MEGVPSGPSRGPAFKGRPPSTATPPTAPRARTATASRGRGLGESILAADPLNLGLTTVQRHPQDQEQPLHFHPMYRQDLEDSTDTKTVTRAHRAQNRWIMAATVTLGRRIEGEVTNSGGIWIGLETTIASLESAGGLRQSRTADDRNVDELSCIVLANSTYFGSKR